MVSLHGNELRFECSNREKPFLVAALREVTQDLQNLASSLSIPSAALNKMMRNVLTVEHTAPLERIADNDLRRYLKNFLYLPNAHAGSKEEAIRNIVNVFAEKNLLQDTKTAAELILKRETSMSSGIEHGIAIPHARTDFVEGLIGAVAVFPEGIPEYETLDHSKVRIVIVSLTSRSTHSPQIRLLSFISQLLNEEGRKRLLAAKTEEDMRKIFLP
ncbi:MAG: PTS sugar transporter subunit IIA [Kiritimatiellia bacterium]